MNTTWEKFEVTLKNYSDIFKAGKYNKDIFFWSYEFVMTRCYGWSLPSTVLLPLADFINHDSKTGVTHYLIHKGFEENTERKHPGYNLKKNYIDFSMLNSEKMRLEKSEKEKIYGRYRNESLEYLRKSAKNLEESDVLLENFNITKDSEKIHKAIDKVNIKLLKEKGSDKHIFDMEFFESTDEEDNDSGFKKKI